MSEHIAEDSKPAPLEPHSAAFVARVNQPGALPFHAMPLETQRAAQHKMLVSFAPKGVAAAAVLEQRIARAASAGGDLRCRVYPPAGSDAAQCLPALIWFHGGGCTVGSLEGFDVVCHELANRSGCKVVAIDCRKAPEHAFPAAMDDSFYAVKWVAENSARLNIDPTRLAIGGDSAGGNLAIVCALRCRDEGGPRLQFQLLVYPDTDKRLQRKSHQEFANGYVLTRDLLLTFRKNYLPNEDDFLDWRASPILAPSLHHLPPALVIAASHDPLRDDIRAFVQRLHEAGVPAELIEYPGTVHNFFTLGGIIPAANEAVARSAEALRAAMVDHTEHIA